MTLSDLLKMDSALTVSNIQKAFVYTVQRLRFDPSLLLIKLTGRIRFGELGTALKNKIGSEFGFRSITEVMNGNINGKPVYKPLSIGNECLVGQCNLPLAMYGFDSVATDCKYSGDSWAILEKTLENCNSETSLGFLNVYLYPYFVRVTASPDPHVTKHVYDIQTMIDLHGADNLSVDLAMMMPLALVAKSYVADDMVDIGTSNNCMTLATKMINLYNNNMQSLVLRGDGGDIGCIKPYDFESSGGIYNGII